MTLLAATSEKSNKSLPLPPETVELKDAVIVSAPSPPLKTV